MRHKKYVPELFHEVGFHCLSSLGTYNMAASARTEMKIKTHIALKLCSFSNNRYSDEIKAIREHVTVIQ
jgi:hypothetical protein